MTESNWSGTAIEQQLREVIAIHEKRIEELQLELSAATADAEAAQLTNLSFHRRLQRLEGPLQSRLLKARREADMLKRAFSQRAARVRERDELIAKWQEPRTRPGWWSRFRLGW